MFLLVSLFVSSFSVGLSLLACSIQSLLLREVTVEGLSKLLLAGRVVSSKLLVRLFLHWYNPALQNDSVTTSVLGAFFTEYSSSGQLVNMAYV